MWTIVRLMIGTLFAVATAHAAVAAENLLFPGRPTDWLLATMELGDEQSSRPISAEGISVALTDGEGEGGPVAVMTVQYRKQEVLRIEGPPTFNPLAIASIVEMDDANSLPEVVFAAYSGGAHCCTEIRIAVEVAGSWTVVDAGPFDGFSDYLEDLDGDGNAELNTVDNRFLYTFGSYAESFGPLDIYALHAGVLTNVSAEPRFREAHQVWLDRNFTDPTLQSPGYLAGWVAAKSRVGQGEEAMRQVAFTWDRSQDPGWDVCLNGGTNCPDNERVTLQFPEALALFLERNGFSLSDN